MDASKDTFPSEIITMKGNTKNSDSQERSVKSYASGVFRDSTIGIVASIVTTSSRARRYFKSLLLMLCISGFLYQCITYLDHVFEYPTVVDIEIKRPRTFNMPAYTFCNNNGMKRSVFCAMYPDHCFESNDKFCSRFFSQCERNKTLVPKKKYYHLEDSMSYEEILEYGSNLTEFLVYPNNTQQEKITGPYIRVKHDDDNEMAMSCYSLHSVVNSLEKPEQGRRRVYNFDDRIREKLVFNVEEESEMLIPSNVPGVIFSVHSPYEAVNPFIRGKFLRPGKRYNIYISMTEDNLLKSPYGTECLDYEEIWAANNRTGPRIQSMCEQKCLFELSMRCFNCSLPSFLYPHSERICTKVDTGTEYLCEVEKFEILYSCADRCKEDCRYTTYKWDVIQRFESDYDEDTDPEELWKYVTVETFIDDEEVITLKHSPKYMTVEVFSSIGGFIGVWLGISLMDIIDVFASFFTVSRYAARKHKKQHTNTR